MIIRKQLNNVILIEILPITITSYMVCSFWPRSKHVNAVNDFLEQLRGKHERNAVQASLSETVEPIPLKASEGHVCKAVPLLSSM